jgi:hypothetical protein
MAETLRADRSRDWQDLIGTWSEKLLQGPETATVFDLNGEPVPTDKAMMCSQREAEWADFKTPPGEILVAPLAQLRNVAIQQQGMPSKLYVGYKGRVVFVPRGEVVRLSLYTRYGAGVAVIGSTVHRGPLLG